MENNMELIRVTTDENGNQLVSARELHEFLKIKERFNSWFNRMLQFDFTENEDFTSVKTFTLVNNGASRELDDYALTLNCAKEISMVQRSDKGKLARQYFIACEKKLKEVIQKPMTTAQMFALQAKAMLEMEERMNVMEEKINFVYEQYQNGQKQLALLPLSEEPMPEQSLRSQINELVRSYAKMVGADYKDVWIRVYKDLYYRYGVSVNAIKSIKNRETKLEKLERTGNLSKARIVISEMIRMYKSNSIF